MHVVLANRQRTRKVDLRLWKRITAALLTDMKVEDAGLGIHLVAAPEIIRLNEKFLGHQGTTDVITFDYAEFRRRTSDVRRRLHGEIFICMDEAVWQARKFRTSWQSEIVRYLAHGVLHLIGYDDAHAGERREMKRAENRLLRQISRRFSLAQLARRAKLCA